MLAVPLLCEGIDQVTIRPGPRRSVAVVAEQVVYDLARGAVSAHERVSLRCEGTATRFAKAQGGKHRDGISLVEYPDDGNIPRPLWLAPVRSDADIGLNGDLERKAFVVVASSHHCLPPYCSRRHLASSRVQIDENSLAPPRQRYLHVVETSAILRLLDDELLDANAPHAERLMDGIQRDTAALDQQLYGALLTHGNKAPLRWFHTDTRDRPGLAAVVRPRIIAPRSSKPAPEKPVPETTWAATLA